MGKLVVHPSIQTWHYLLTIVLGTIYWPFSSKNPNNFIAIFLFVYLYLFGLNRGLKILFGLFWLPKSPLLDRSDPIKSFQIETLMSMHVE